MPEKITDSHRAELRHIINHIGDREVANESGVSRIAIARCLAHLPTRSATETALICYLERKRGVK